MILTIEFVKGIPGSLENDSYLDVNICNLFVIDYQMMEAGKDNRILNLFTKGSHHRNLSVHYLRCAKSIPPRQKQPKHQLKQSLLGVSQEPSG